MRTASFVGGERIVIEDRPEPVPAPGELLIRVLSCALCGSELRLWRHGGAVTPGHEIVGLVEAPGHRLDGRRVLVYIPVFCGTCAMCARGAANQCEQLEELVGWQRDGGYAEALAVPERCLIAIPDDIPTDLAPLLLDAVGTPAHGIRLARKLVDGGPAAVIGCGPVGLGAVLALQHLGFAEVHVAEPVAHRRDLAASFGAADLGDEDASPRFPLVVEASGKDAGRQRALELVASGGCALFLGESEAWQIVETRSIRRKDFHILRSFYFPLTDVAENLAMLRAAPDQYRRLVDATAPLEALPDLFASFARGERVKPLCTPA